MKEVHLKLTDDSELSVKEGVNGVVGLNIEETNYAVKVHCGSFTCIFPWQIVEGVKIVWK